MFQFPAFPILTDFKEKSHSEILGSMPTCGSPRHIVACHVLLRRSEPSHPPDSSRFGLYLYPMHGLINMIYDYMSRIFDTKDPSTDITKYRFAQTIMFVSLNSMSYYDYDFLIMIKACCLK
jgi:hypothetical protein